MGTTWPCFNAPTAKPNIHGKKLMLLLIGKNSCRFRNFAKERERDDVSFASVITGYQYSRFENAFREIHAYALHTPPNQIP